MTSILVAALSLALLAAASSASAGTSDQVTAQSSKSKRPKCRLNPNLALPACATPRVLGLWARTQHYLACPWVWGEVEKRITVFRAELAARGWSVVGSNGSYICKAPDRSNMLVKNGLGRVTASNSAYGPGEVTWYWTQVLTLTKKGLLRSTFSMGDGGYIPPCEGGRGTIACPFLPSFV